MVIRIEVVAPTDERDGSFRDLRLFHAGCGVEELSKGRNPATDTYLLRCPCGLQIEVPNEGAAIGQILRTSIDERERQLPPDSYRVEGNQQIIVSSRAGIQ